MRLRGSEQIGITHFQKYYAFRNFLEKYYILSALFRGLFENVLQKQIKTIILDRFFALEFSRIHASLLFGLLNPIEQKTSSQKPVM